MRAILSVALLAAALAAGTALAQPYPSKPIRLIAPWPPGGVTDVLARAVAQAMGDSMGQPLVVENRPGAGGTIGMGLVAKAPPDGYTVAASDVPTHAISATLYAKLPYDVLKDFDTVGVVGGSPMLLATNRSFNVQTLPEFVQRVKASPGKYSYASSGNGSLTHLAMERLKREAGIEMIHVPFKGTVPAIQSVLAGDTIVAFGTIPGVVPHAKAEKLAVLGASFAKRFAQIPDVPPIADHLPGFDMGFYTALWVPATTPQEIVDRLNRELTKAFAQPRVKEVFAASAAEQGNMSPAQLRDYMQSEVKAWGDVVRAIGLKVD